MLLRTFSLWMILALACLLTPVAAETVPLFGPETFVLTDGENQFFQRSLESELEGTFLLYLRNGDGESARVSSASVGVNGQAVILASDLDEQTRGVVRPVELLSGVNELTLALVGDPGSFVTLVLAPSGEPPVFVAGRLLLPWGRRDGDHGLALALRNDSRRAPRLVRVIFYGPGGQIQAASDDMSLPPLGSVAFAVEDAIDLGQWTIGSVEVIYTGPGPGRLFGTARQGFPFPAPHTETQPLVQAGFGILEEHPSQPANGSRRRGF